jgi:hypothetical protein
VVEIFLLFRNLVVWQVLLTLEPVLGLLLNELLMVEKEENPLEGFMKSSKGDMPPKAKLKGSKLLRLFDVPRLVGPKNTQNVRTGKQIVKNSCLTKETVTEKLPEDILWVPEGEVGVSVGEVVLVL